MAHIITEHSKAVALNNLPELGREPISEMPVQRFGPKTYVNGSQNLHGTRYVICHAWVNTVSKYVMERGEPKEVSLSLEEASEVLEHAGIKATSLERSVGRNSEQPIANAIDFTPEG